MLVGDAAHQINPMTGGGIVSGMKAGWIAGQVAADAVKTSDYSEKKLQAYPDAMWKDFGKNYERFYNIKQAVENLTDDDLNRIADSVLSIPHNKRTLASVFKAAVFRKPSLIIDVLKVFAGV
jgi:digeranylgeranylglycerophospholipid reductase